MGENQQEGSCLFFVAVGLPLIFMSWLLVGYLSFGLYFYFFKPPTNPPQAKIEQKEIK